MTTAQLETSSAKDESEWSFELYTRCVELLNRLVYPRVGGDLVTLIRHYLPFPQFAIVTWEHLPESGPSATFQHMFPSQAVAQEYCDAVCLSVPSTSAFPADEEARVFVPKPEHFSGGDAHVFGCKCAE